MTGKQVTVRTIATVVGWTGAFALLHSLLAAHPLKELIRRRYGARAFNGLYRLCFNALAVTTFTGLLIRFSRLPDNTVYAVRRPWSWPLRVVQLIGVMVMVDANVRIGVGRMTGVQGAWELVSGGNPIDQNPAQGPQLEGDLAYRTAGSFRLSRHPNNLAPLVLFAANPTMTVRFLAFTVVSAIYLLLGSVHEEQRLKAVYGTEYDRYRDGRPFYLPLLQ